MGFISGFSLQTALSIMLVSTLIFAQVASTSVLEITDDASPSGENEDTRDTDANERFGMGFASGGDAATADGVSTYRYEDAAAGDFASDDCLGIDSLRTKPHTDVSDAANSKGRQSDDPNHDSNGDGQTDEAENDHADTDSAGNDHGETDEAEHDHGESDEAEHDHGQSDEAEHDHGESDEAGNGHGSDSAVDWYLPDGVDILLTAAGEYVLLVTSEDGVVHEEIMTLEEIEHFLLTHYPDFYDEDDYYNEDEWDEWDEWDEEWEEDWWEPVPEVYIEFLDNGNLLVVHQLGDEVWYDYIMFAEDGSITVLRIDAWGVAVTHPAAPHPDRHGGHGGHDGGPDQVDWVDWDGDANGPRMAAAGIPFDDPCGGSSAEPPVPVDIDWTAILVDGTPQRSDAQDTD